MLKDTARPIQILGVNEIGLESDNELITSGRTIPWLQSTSDDDAWTLWNVEYRDVYVVGADSEHVATYNLTEHDLAEPANYSALKSMLLSAANE